ncbi:fungal-specific transcription factor domain-containing protein [Mycena crocata]|nr:fungal-specific transcription factor domain-containing protein [Mycena crocata]
MSSNEDDHGYEYQRGKHRRLERACDLCRRWRSRCNGSREPRVECSTCVDAKLECTYGEPPRKRTPGQKSTYIDTLEARLEHSDAVVSQLRAELAAVRFDNWEKSSGTVSAGTSQSAESSTHLDGQTATLHILRMGLRALSVPPPPQADDIVHLDIGEKFERLSLLSPEHSFVGKGSNPELVKVAIDLKADVKREEERRSLTPREERRSVTPGEGRSPHTNIAAAHGKESKAEERDDVQPSSGGPGWTSRRLQYWTFKPWGKTIIRRHNYSFPPAQLMRELVGLYFEHVNVYLPLLHRPTFERSVGMGLHFRDNGFAATLLLVCAVASRWSTDPRVMALGGTQHPSAANSDLRNLACGWGWFDQVPPGGDHLFGQATLYELQYYCLAALFLEGTSAPQAGWTLIGVGLRLAQDVGAHRRASSDEPSIERELYKRAFWVLVYMDRTSSAGTGRPCAIQNDDFDLDPPIEVDEEYWEHPTHPFQQPPGIPSRVSFFNALLRLNHLLAFALKMLNSPRKLWAVFQTDDSFEENAVAELDSALNDWRDQMPEHLRWDPLRRDQTFFDQSVALHCGYYHLQMMIHRPFIPVVRESSPMALPSLAICSSAARACANMVDVQRQRKGHVPVFINVSAVFTSGILLLLNVWSGKRTGLVQESSRDIENVHKCMEVLRLCEQRWQAAGLIWDILAELASVGQLQLPNHGNPRITGYEHEYNGDLRVMETMNHATSLPLNPTQQYYTEPPLSESPSHSMPDPCVSHYSSHDDPVYDTQYTSPYASRMPSFSDNIGDPRSIGPTPMAPDVFVSSPQPSQWFPHEDLRMDADPAQASRELGNMMSAIDSDILAMWTNAPTGFQANDWGTYFTNFSEITQGQQPDGSTTWRP